MLTIPMEVSEATGRKGAPGTLSGAHIRLLSPREQCQLQRANACIPHRHAKTKK